MTGRATLFSLVAVPTYTAGYYFNWPLFFYYPKVGLFSLTAQPGSGFAILWYGWLVAAILAGALAAFCVPRRWSERLPPDLTWIMLTAALCAVFVYEKRWFF